MNATKNLSQVNVSNKLSALKLLKSSASLWFVVATLGQWMFVIYIVGFYYSSTLAGNFGKWNERLENGFIKDDLVGNIALFLHIILAAIIIGGGPLQFIPQIRKHFRKFHRWNGRIYIIIAFVMSIGGLIMTWQPHREQAGGPLASLGVSLDGVLIILFAILAWRTALKRDFLAHGHWAFRLFLAVNAVWFFRIGLMLWLFINQGPLWFDPKTFTGPFITFLGFAQAL
ncbi:MAG: DUF2306 domain-containing protein, partial [Bacteroidota bacterium]